MEPIDYVIYLLTCMIIFSVVMMTIDLSSPLISQTFVNLNKSSSTYGGSIALYQKNAWNSCIYQARVEGIPSAGGFLIASQVDTYTPLPPNSTASYVGYYDSVYQENLKVCI